jgi:hypothetical protein
VAVGYIAAHLFIRGPIPFPPIDVVDWLPILAVVGSTAGFLKSASRMEWKFRVAVAESSTPQAVPARELWRRRLRHSHPMRELISLAISLATVFLITRPMIRNVWSTGETVAWLSGLIVAMTVFEAIVDTTVSRNPGSIVPFVLGLVTAALAVVQGLSSSLLLARLDGAAAITIAPLAFVAWRWPREGLVRGALPVILVLFYATLMAGFFYSEISRGSALVLALSPLAVAFSLVEQRHRIGVVLAVAVAVSCAGAAVGIAIATATPEEY